MSQESVALDKSPSKQSAFASFTSRLDEGQTVVERIKFWGGMMLGFGGWSLVGFFGIEEDFPIFLFGSICLGGVTALAIAFLLANEPKQRRILLIVVALAIACVAAYAFRTEHNRELREKAQQAAAENDYILRYDRPRLDPIIIANKRGPHGGPLLAGIRIGLVFNNENPFDIWVKSFRRHVEVDGETSKNDESTVYSRVPRLTPGMVLTDFDIEFKNPVEFSEQTTGLTDFELCYGKQKNQMTKGFWQKAKFIFKPDENGNPGPPLIIPVDMENGPHQYLDTCRG